MVSVSNGLLVQGKSYPRNVMGANWSLCFLFSDPNFAQLISYCFTIIPPNGISISVCFADF